MKSRRTACRRLDHQRRQRQQHDRAQEERGEAERQPESGQRARAATNAARRPCSGRLGRARRSAPAAPAAPSSSVCEARRLGCRQSRDAEHQHLSSDPTESSRVSSRVRVAEAKLGAHVEAVVGGASERASSSSRRRAARSRSGVVASGTAEQHGLGGDVAQQARGNAERRRRARFVARWMTTRVGSWALDRQHQHFEAPCAAAIPRAPSRRCAAATAAQHRRCRGGALEVRVDARA